MFLKEPFVSRVLKISLYAVFALGVLGVATLPHMLDFYAKTFYDTYYPEPGYRAFITAFLMLTSPFFGSSGFFGDGLARKRVSIPSDQSQFDFVERLYP